MTCRPWLSLPNPLVALPPQSTSASVLDLVPEDIFLAANSGYPSPSTRREIASTERTSIFDESEPEDFSPLNIYATRAERHEQIAMSLTLHSHVAEPYMDNLPCPGSGPGSPALSVATVKVAPAVVPQGLKVDSPEPPDRMYSKSPSPYLPEEVLFLPAEEEVDRTPIARYLSDTSQAHEWLAVVLQQPASLTEQHHGCEPNATEKHSPTPSISLDGSQSGRDTSDLATLAPTLAGASSVLARVKRPVMEDMDDEEEGEWDADLRAPERSRAMKE